MRKRIAVFAGGWGGEYLQETLDGIIKAAEKVDVDVFAFINFSVHADNLEANIPEVNLFTLPDMEDFDGVILLANSFNASEEMTYLTQGLKIARVPAISVEYEIEGIPTVQTDNYAGMYELADHVMKEHTARSVIYMGGPKEHPECQERLKALLDAAQDNCIEIPEENILYADWSKVLIPDLLDEWRKKHEVFPDAIICANDIMAIGVCDYLREKGLRVPEDIIVTGYDCLRQAQIYIPAVTSVNHEWNRMGSVAFEQLFEEIEGKTVPMYTGLKTRFVPGGTCGCQMDSFYNARKTSFGRRLTGNEMDALLIDSHFRHFYIAVRKAENREDLYYSFSHLFKHEHDIEGDNFMICLDPEFFHVVEKDRNLHQRGHSDVYDIVCSLKDGESQEYIQKNKKEAIFGMSERAEKAGYYLFIPLYSEVYTYGFAVLTGMLNVAGDNQFYTWSRHMIQSLEQARRNITIADLYKKVMTLSVTDALTGVYNRTGCEQIAYPELIDWQSKGGTDVIMLVDVDHMKTINDKYGHASGDKALCIVTSVLKQELPRDFAVARFGGDEFFVGGRLIEKSQNMEALVDKLEQALANELERQKVDFPLTISIGCAKVCPKDVMDIEKAIVQADINMYQKKKLHHQNG